MSRNRQSSGGSLLSMIIVLIVLLFFVVISLGLFRKNPDGSIGINVTTGKVQVDIVDTEGNSLVGDILNFTDPDGDGELFFEPSTIVYTQGFRIRNEGNLAISYHMYVSDGEGVDKEKFEEAFEFWLATDPTNLDRAERLLSFTGELEPSENSEIYYLVLRMKETAGNEFQDKTFKGIGITVNATQRKESVE